MTAAAQEDYVDRNEILPLLGPVKRSGEWLMALCPAHADGTKHGGKGGESLGLSNTGVLRCFAGCEFKDVIAALRGPTYRAPQPIRQQSSTPESLVKVYEYKDAAGVVVAEKGRFEASDGRKTFRWRLPGAESWSGGVQMPDMPLYNLPLLMSRSDDPVYFVEGEKACDACVDAGLLAVTLGGGAGQKEFGKSLDPLRGRTVYLWADNDAPGAAYMTLIQAKLEAVRADTRIVSVPIALPPKADAYDYFAAGGTVDELHAASPYEPVVTILADDAVRVAMPTSAGLVTFDFSEMEKGPRALDCAMVISCQSSREAYNERLNLDSSSARSQLRIDLEKFYGKEFAWASLLNKAVYRARETYLLQERAVDLFDVPDPIGEAFLIPPLMPAEGSTVFFGDGSSGKSYITLLMALCSSHGIDFCGMRTPEMRVMVVDYEDSANNMKRRLNRLAEGLGGGALPIGVYYWPANGIPLKDQWEAIKRSCDRNGIGWLIIDSAAPACGGPPEDAVSALAFFRTLKRIGLPALVIAHISKAGEGNTQRPFGSVFWHNEPRRTWYVKRIQEDESDEIDVGLYCRKVNDGRRPAPIGLHLSFAGLDGPVRMGLRPLNEVPELLSETSTRNQIWEALDRPMTVDELIDAAGLTRKAIEHQLTRGPFVRAGTRAEGRGRPQVLWTREETRIDPRYGN